MIESIFHGIKSETTKWEIHLIFLMIMSSELLCDWVLNRLLTSLYLIIGFTAESDPTNCLIITGSPLSSRLVALRLSERISFTMTKSESESLWGHVLRLRPFWTTFLWFTLWFDLLLKLFKSFLCWRRGTLWIIIVSRIIGLATANGSEFLDDTKLWSQIIGILVDLGAQDSTDAFWRTHSNRQSGSPHSKHSLPAIIISLFIEISSSAVVLISDGTPNSESLTLETSGIDSSSESRQLCPHSGSTNSRQHGQRVILL